MKIAIIGGGSIGLLFAHYLSVEHEVTIYTRTKEQAVGIGTKGIYLERGRKAFRTKVNAAVINEWAGEEDLHVIAVKQYQLCELMELCPVGSCEGNFLFLQNGMGHLELLSKMEAPRIFVGSVEHGAYRLNGNTVRHNGIGVTRVASYIGSLDFMAGMISSTPKEFPMVAEADYLRMLQRKLIANAVINPLTAILNIPNGQLVDNPYYFRNARDLFHEIAEVLEIENKEDSFENIVSICRKTAENRSSMLKDMEENRSTEIDAILGYLLKAANQNNVDTPLIQNYYQLIKGKEYERERK